MSKKKTNANNTPIVYDKMPDMKKHRWVLSVEINDGETYHQAHLDAEALNAMFLAVGCNWAVDKEKMNDDFSFDIDSVTGIHAELVHDYIHHFSTEDCLSREQAIVQQRRDTQRDATDKMNLPRIMPPLC